MLLRLIHITGNWNGISVQNDKSPILPCLLTISGSVTMYSRLSPNRITLSSRITDLLFGRNGIGLTIHRYNIWAGSHRKIPGPWHRTKTLEISPGKCDWSRDAAAVRILIKTYPNCVTTCMEPMQHPARSTVTLVFSEILLKQWPWIVSWLDMHLFRSTWAPY